MVSIQSVLVLSMMTASVEFLEFSAPWCGPCQNMKPTIERLQADGVPIKVVSFDDNRSLANQVGVTRIPAIVAIQDGKVVDRIVGNRGYVELRTRLTQIARAAELDAHSETAPGHRAQPVPPQSPVVRGQTEPARNSIGNPFSALANRLKKQPNDSGFTNQGSLNQAASPATRIPAIEGGRKNSALVLARAPVGAYPATNNLQHSLTQAEKQAVTRAMHATVRLRIKDDKGISLGTGTIVDVHEDEALVLTCGHIFRSSGGKGPIACDLFAPGAPASVHGKLIGFDPKRDVGLVSIRPRVRIEPVLVGGSGCRAVEGDVAFSIGCNQGDDPTVVRDKVLSVNRYLGPANLVVGGRPIQGRSGGGLFNREGVLIGVCNAADPNANEGLYAALGPIHAELDSAQLGFVYRNSVASTATSDPSVVPGQLARSFSDEAPLTKSMDQNPASVLDLERPAGKQKPEVICIVRPRGTEGTSQAYVLDSPSESLLTELSRELGRRGPHFQTNMRTERPQPQTFRRQSEWRQSPSRN